MPSSQLFETLPIYARMLDEDGILEHICNAIQPQIDAIAQRLENRNYYFDPITAPPGLLPFLGQFAGLASEGDYYLGIGINPDWRPEHQRDVILRAPQYWKRKGTDWGIREAIALWLLFEGAHDFNQLMIKMPFGDLPTSMPPQWWHYSTLYGADQTQPWNERQFWGAGDYSQNHRGDYLNLSGTGGAWNFGYGDTWSSRELISQVAPIRLTDGSGLGAERPWMHFFAREDQWNNLFPDSLRLNPEIWSTYADPVVFGWLTYKLISPIVLIESQAAAQVSITELIEYEGFKYGENWYADFTIGSTQTLSTSEWVEFGIAPGHGYPDEWTSEDSPCPSDYLYYAPHQQTLVTSTQNASSPGQCKPGLTTEITTGYENKLVGGIPEILPNQILARRDAYSLRARVNLTYRVRPRFPHLRINNEGIPLYQPRLLGNQPWKGAIQTGNLIIPSRESRVSLSARSPFIDMESPIRYSWIDPLWISTYHTLWNDGGEEYYWLGEAEVLPKSVSLPILKIVPLCNYFENYSIGLLSRYEQIKIPLPREKQDDLKLYPILNSILKGENWTLLLETIETIYLLHPATMFFASSSEDGILSDRSLVLDLQTGRTTLYLEFLIQTDIEGDFLRSLTLNLSGEHLQTRTLPALLELSPETITAIRFRVPLRFTSGADNLPDHWSITDYSPLIQESLNQLSNPLFPNAVPPLYLPPLTTPIPTNNLPTIASLKALLNQTNLKMDEILNRVKLLHPGGDQVFAKTLTGGIRTQENGLLKTVFVVPTGIGSDRFSVVQIREIEGAQSDVSRPTINIVNTDNIELVFWGDDVDDDTLEVWGTSLALQSP